MRRKLASLVFLVALVSPILLAQNKPSILVKPFTLASNVQFPYDLNQLQLQTVTELKIKDGQQFDVLSAAPTSGIPSYALDGEVLSWHPGNRAARMMVGMGSGRETAEIHYWLTDDTGKKVFEHTDTIRQAFWGNAYANSVGQLAQPFADKIAARLKESKVH